MDKHVFRISEAAKHSRISRTKLYYEISAGRLKARKIGRATVILRSDLQEWLSRLPCIDPHPAAPNVISEALRDSRS